MSSLFKGNSVTVFTILRLIRNKTEFCLIPWQRKVQEVLSGFNQIPFALIIDRSQFLFYTFFFVTPYAIICKLARKFLWIILMFTQLSIALITVFFKDYMCKLIIAILEVWKIRIQYKGSRWKASWSLAPRWKALGLKPKLSWPNLTFHREGFSTVTNIKHIQL